MVPTAGGSRGRRNWLVPASGGPGEDTGDTHDGCFSLLRWSWSPSSHVASDFVCCSVLSCVWLFATPMDCTTPGSPVLHHPPKLAQTRVHWVSDAIHPLTVSSFAASFSACPQSFPASRSFPTSWLFAPGDSVNSKLKKAVVTQHVLFQDNLWGKKPVNCYNFKE